MNASSASQAPAGTPSWTVGDIRVQRIDEIALPAQTGRWLLPEATADMVAQAPWLQPDFADGSGTLHLASHSFAISHQGLRILVDTGIGNGKSRPNPAWDNLSTGYLGRLAAAGFAPEAVDLVILTHLHTDHVGWNTRATGGVWRPTFPNAGYVVSRVEWEYWAGTEMEESRRQMFRDSVHPVNDAGLLRLVEVPDAGAEVAPGVRLRPTPGHTPGHIAVELHSGPASALITGDCVHHPVQLHDPAVGSCVDVDAEQAARTRRRLLASLADTGTLVLGTHFPPPTGGLVVTEGDSYRMVPSPGQDERVGSC
ncbi:MBL fold metallo-hydrolase [Streptomyces sp. NPDC002004]